MKLTLNDCISLLEERALLSAPVPEGLDRSAPVELVSYDSREVVPGTLFLCKGAHFKVDFLNMALEKGAVAYVSERPYPEVALPCLQVTDMRQSIAPLADRFYDHPSGKLKVIGLTGTKGKTTAAYYLKFILDEYLKEQGKPDCGLISSIQTWDGAERFESHMTTPEPLELQRHFVHALDAGMEYLVMEVSSQALKYHRSLCVDFAAAAFLNIGYDHISPIEHPDFEDYFTSKLKIFRQGAVNCVNLDCDHADHVLEAAQTAGAPVLTFSREDPSADVYASQVRKEGEGLRFPVRTPRLQREFRLPMPGLFNVENALCAIALSEALDIPERCVYAGLAKAHVPGRMEVYTSSDKKVTAIVDFAHNGMSFEHLCRSALAEYPGHRLVAIFGSVGDKALDRRQALGEAAGRYAHLSVITEDDSGEEDTRSICEEIASYVSAQGGQYQINLNRGEAIRQAILDCREPTVLLIAGKGTETYQKRGQEYVPTPTDGEYAQSFLREYDMLHSLDGLEKARMLLSLLPALERRRGKRVAVCGDSSDLDALRALGMETVSLSTPAEAQGADCLILLTEGPIPAERMDLCRAEEFFSQANPTLAPHLRACLDVLQGGVSEAAILDGAKEHALLLWALEEQTPGLVIAR